MKAQNRNNKVAMIIAAAVFIITFIGVAGFVKDDKVSAVGAGADIRQGDTLRLTSEDWTQDYIVLNPTKTNAGTPGMFLLQKEYSEKTDFESGGLSNIWEGSTAQSWCVKYWTTLPTSVRDAIIGVKTNETESGYDFAGINNIDGTRTGIKDKVFFLSVKEYYRYQEAAGISSPIKWMLRSPGTDCSDIMAYVCVVMENNEIKPFGVGYDDPDVDMSLPARPAFNIALPDDVCATKTVEEGQAVWTVDMGHADHECEGVSYTWSEDNRTCTASGTCVYCGEQITEQVKATYAVAQAAAQDSEGTVTYTAAFKKPVFDTQIKEEKTEHDYGTPSYTWSADNSTCTAKAVCALCSKAATETAKATPKVVRTATTHAAGETRYTAVFKSFLFEDQNKYVTTPQLEGYTDNTRLGVGDHIYLGDEKAAGYTGIPYWRVVDKDPSDGSYLLMSEYLWAGDGASDPTCLIQFNKDGDAFNYWQGSDAQVWCRAFEQAVLSGIDGLTIKETTKSDAFFQSPDADIIQFSETNHILNNDRVFFLSGEEAVHYMPDRPDRKAGFPAGMRPDNVNEDVSWWLRSPRDGYSHEHCAGRVFSVGAVNKQYIDGECAARPAFWAVLNMDQENADWDVVHSFGTPSYSWSSDKKACTAKMTCKNCGAVITEKARVTAKVTRKATANATGVTTHAATFKNKAFKTQTKTTSIAMLFAAGAKRTVGGSTYQVLSPKALTVALIKANNVKSFTVPNTVRIQGKTCKVVQVNAKSLTGSRIRTVTLSANVQTLKPNAFTSSKATKIIARTKKLKKASVRNSLKSSRVGTVQVVVGNKKQNKAYVKTYKKIFTKGNAGKKATVK